MIIEYLCCFIYVNNVIFVQILEDLLRVQAHTAGVFLFCDGELSGLEAQN